MGTVVLVRHGEAEGNSHHRLIGWSDVGLTETGRRQAELVAQRLTTASIHSVVSSDLRRTLETASPLVESMGVEPILDPRFREIDNGEWTGLTPLEISERWPEMWGRYTGGVDVDRPGGERWSDVGTRVIAAMKDLLSDDGVTVVFSHGGPLVIAAAWALGIEMRGNIFNGPIASAENASFCTVAPGPRLLGYNDIGHLRPIARVDVPYEPVEVDPT